MEPMAYSRRRRHLVLLRVFGVEVAIGWSWLLVLGFYLFLLTPYFHSLLGGGYTRAYLVTVVAVLAFFGCLVAHELGHALTARRLGARVLGVQLWALGGFTRTESPAAMGPKRQLAIAAAGPLVNGVILAVVFGVGVAVWGVGSFPALIIGESRGPAQPLELLLAWVAGMNGLLLAFNLLPAYPLDGSQILYAALSLAGGNQPRALIQTGRIGELLSIAAGLAGFYLLTKANSLSLPLLILGVFAYQSSQIAVNQGAMALKLSRVTVGQALDRSPQLIEAGLPLLDCWDRYFAGRPRDWLVVVDHQHHFLGAVSGDRIAAEIRAGRPALKVEEIAEGTDELGLTLGEQLPLEQVLQLDAIRRWGGLVAVDGEGVVKGVLKLNSLQRALRA